MLAPIDTLIRRSIRRSRAESDEILRRFEVRYGPHAPRLNAIEVVANYLSQSLPGFRPTAQGPGALEVLSAYSTTYGSGRDDEPVAVSLFEIGLRHYLYEPGWGRRGLGGLLRPSYASLGFAMADEEDGALRFPDGSHKRLGAFLGWGDVKVAWVSEDGRPRWLVSRSLQIVPFVF